MTATPPPPSTTTDTTGTTTSTSGGSAPRRWLWRVGLLVALAALLALVATQYRTVAGSLAGSRAEQRTDACLPGTAVPVLESPHVGQQQSGQIRYNSVPATSGPHYAFAANTGIYSSPVAEPSFVHTMEHGHVVIVYAPTMPRDDVRTLERITRQHSEDVLLTPYPRLERGVSLAAWGRIQRLDTVDEAAIIAFVTALAGRYDHGWVGEPCTPGHR